MTDHKTSSPSSTSRSAEKGGQVPPPNEAKSQKGIAAAPPAAPDPFDPASLRIDPASDPELGVKKVLLHVPVRKPKRQEFVRVRPGLDHQLPMAILELEEERETYAVDPEVAKALPGEVRIVDMRVAISRTGTPFLWPVPRPPADGRQNPWHETNRAAAELAEREWVRMAADRGAGYYEVRTASADIPEPEWPEETLGDMLRVAFGNGRLIDSVDHPVIQRLLGG